MNLTRLALIGFVGACAWAAWLSQTGSRDTHVATRQFVIRSTLGRVDDPIIILGDSIVEASTPPRSICGHPVVNAGIGGASTTSGIETAIATPANSTRPQLVVIALGANDAAKPLSADQFIQAYRSLIARLRPLGARMAILGIAPPEPGLPEADKAMEQLIGAYNERLPAVAAETGVDFIPMPPMPARHTLDGLHLDANGYAVWDATVSSGIARLLCPANRTSAQP